MKYRFENDIGYIISPNKVHAMSKLFILIFCCILLGGCALGTYENPLAPPSIPSSDKEYATVVFYPSDVVAGRAFFGKKQEYLAFIDVDEIVETIPISQAMIATRQGLTESKREYSVVKISPGIHTFWLPVGLIKRGEQTADLKAGETYYLSVRFEGAGGTGFLRFTDEDNFLKESNGAVEIRLTEGFGVSFLGKLTYKYELVK